MRILDAVHRPRNELDQLLNDDDEDGYGDGMLKTHRQPWRPPQFKGVRSEEIQER